MGRKKMSKKCERLYSLLIEEGAERFKKELHSFPKETTIISVAGELMSFLGDRGFSMSVGCDKDSPELKLKGMKKINEVLKEKWLAC